MLLPFFCFGFVALPLTCAPKQHVLQFDLPLSGVRWCRALCRFLGCISLVVVFLRLSRVTFTAVVHSFSLLTAFHWEDIYSVSSLPVSGPHGVSARV